MNKTEIGLILGAGGYVAAYVLYSYGLYYGGWFAFEGLGGQQIHAFDYLLIFCGLLMLTAIIYNAGHDDGFKKGLKEAIKQKGTKKHG